MQISDRSSELLQTDFYSKSTCYIALRQCLVSRTAVLHYGIDSGSSALADCLALWKYDAVGALATAVQTAVPCSVGNGKIGCANIG